MFTLNEETERDDSTFTVYRKSILYLIHRALEARRKTPVLGLEENLRDDDRLRRLFGLDGGNGRGEVVFCPTGPAPGRSASGARHHTSFDEDRATMDSILRRVKGLGDQDPVQSFPAEGAPRAFAEESLVDLLEFEDEDEREYVTALLELGRGFCFEARQKRILIGEGGSRLKQIGMDARRDIEKIADKKVMLKLWVKVRSGWSDDERALHGLGYIDKV